MLIECPSCHARAKLPESKEGAKVRCGECGRVYVAHPAGVGGAQRGQRTQTNTGLYLGIGVGGLALIILLFIYARSSPSKPVQTTIAKEPEPEVGEMVDDFGWESPAVQAAVSIHQAAYELNTDRIQNLLHGALVHARAAVLALDEDLRADENRTHALLEEKRDEYLLLEAGVQAELLTGYVNELVHGSGKELVGDWRPYDGRALSLDDTKAVVRLDVSPRDEGVEKRTVDWKLTKVDGRWRAWSWERFLTDAEKASMRKRDRGYEVTTLSDGSVVLEREPEPLEHLADTPQELRDEIDRLFATMIDLDLTKEASRAQARLVEIGRPAIPVLLTGLYEEPLATEDDAIQVNMIVQSLRSITGQYMGFKPQVAVGSGVGTTEERRASAIKQWFAWWYKNQNKFEDKDVQDALEGKIQLSEKDKAWLERNEDK